MLRSRAPNLSVDEGCALLTRASSGCLRVMAGSQPRVWRVHHLYDPRGGGVVIPLSSDLRPPAGTFEPLVYRVEVTGPAERTTPAVVTIVGQAEEVTDPGELDQLAASPPIHWVADEKIRRLRIRPERLLCESARGPHATRRWPPVRWPRRRSGPGPSLRVSRHGSTSTGAVA